MPDIETTTRRATAADAEAVSHLASALFPLGCPANTRPEDLADFISRELTAKRFAEMIADPSVVILVAGTESQLAGFAMIARSAPGRPGPEYPRDELRKFYVRPVYHGRGVAQALMESTLAMVEDDGDGELWLSVFSGNARAIRFYQRWGFRITGTRDFLVGADPQKDYLMQRRPCSC